MRTLSIAICGLVATIVVTCSAGCNAVDLIHAAIATRTETFEVPLPAAKQCRIETVNGKVECIAGNVGEIQVEAEIVARARTSERAEELLDQITIDRVELDGVAEITAHIPRGMSGSVSLTVTLPADIDLTIKTTNGQVSVIGNTEATSVHSSNGGIAIEECAGAIEAKSSNGGIKIHGDRLQQVNAVTSNGAIRIQGEFAPGNHRVRTSNGKIDIEAVGAPIRFMADTSNGQIRANGRKVKKRKTMTLGMGREPSESSEPSIARLALETSNGSIDIEHESAREWEDDEEDDAGDDEDSEVEDSEADDIDEVEEDHEEVEEDDDIRQSEDFGNADDKPLPIGATILKSLGL